MFDHWKYLLAASVCASCQGPTDGLDPYGEQLPVGAGAIRDASAEDRASEDAGAVQNPGNDSGPAPEPSGYFVAVGYGGRRIRSRDNGVTWDADQSDIANGQDDSFLIRDVGWGGDRWVTAAGFNGFIKTSSDGATWSTQTTSIGQWFGSVAFGNGLWVAVGGTGRRSSSTNGGQSWTDRYDSGARNGYRALAYGAYNGHRWVGIGDGGRATYTSDGVTWSLGAGVPGNFELYELAFGNGVFVALVANGSTNYVRSADGGATWTAGQLPNGATGITFGRGRFVILGGGRTMTSGDGATWQSNAAAGLDGSAIAYGNGTYVAVNGTRTFTSPDAVTWTSRTNIAGGNSIIRVRFGGNR